MKTVILEDKNDLVYRIIDPEGVSDETLKSMFYSKNLEFFEKRLPLKSMMFYQNFSDIEKRYNRFINDNLSKSFNAEDFENALLTICLEHQKKGIKWWLTGSAALYVRGISVTPHDIDIMTYLDQKNKIAEFVSPFIVEPFHNVKNWVVKGFGVIDLNIRVDYAFEPEPYVDKDAYLDFGPYAEKHLEKINWKNHEILIPPIALHLRSNMLRQRNEVIRKIHDYMNN